jgi:hypothetical protein
MTQNLSARLTAIVTNLDCIIGAANATDKAYNATIGKPENYKEFGADDVNAVQNNGLMLRVVINGSLAIAELRGDVTDNGRLKAIHDIADWKLTTVEAQVVRLIANAAWWSRNLSRSLERAAREVCMDFASLPEHEVVKDDNLLKANATYVLAKLNN